MNEQTQHSELRQHRIARTHRITSSRIPVIAAGNYKAWNTLAKEMREAKPAPIRSKGRTGVAPLDWGHDHEDWLCAQFWLRHPEYDMHDEHWVYWHDPANKIMWQMCGTSPDRTLYQDTEGFPARTSILEVKCPWRQEIHRDYRETGDLPPEYKPQTHWHMICADTPSCWFVSGDPRLKDDDLNYFEVKVERNYHYQEILLHKVNSFIVGYLSGTEFEPTEYNAETYKEIF